MQQYCQNNRLQVSGVRLAKRTATTSNCANSGSGASGDVLNLGLTWGGARSNSGNLTAQASRNKKATLLFCRELLNAALPLLPSAQQIAAVVSGPLAIALCPICGIGQMIRIETLPCVHNLVVPADSS